MGLSIVESQLSKRCSKCNTIKLLPEFDTNGHSPSGKIRLHSWCKQCLRQYNQNWQNNNKQYFRDWANKNREAIRQQQRIWRLLNPDKLKSGKLRYRNKPEKRQHELDYAKTYRLQHLEAIRTYMIPYLRQYYITHKSECIAYQLQHRTTPSGRITEINTKIKRRAAKMGATIINIKETDEFIRQIKLSPVVVCHICGGTLEGKQAHIDHIIPLARGGTHTKSNIAPSHANCNIRKGASLPNELAKTKSDLKRSWIHKIYDPAISA